MARKKAVIEEEYYIGKIFEGVYPPSAAIWCNKNNAYIEEIDSIEKEVEETYIEIETVEKEVVIPAVTHEEIIPAEYDEDGNVIKEEEVVVVIDEPERTEVVVEEVPVEKTRTVMKTFRRYEIKAIPPAPAPTKEEQERTRANAYASEIDPLHARKARKTILGEWTEEDEAEYVAKVKELSAEIAERYPYPTDPIYEEPSQEPTKEG